MEVLVMKKIRVLPFYRQLWSTVKPYIGMLLLATLIAMLPQQLIRLIPNQPLLSILTGIISSVMELGVCVMILGIYRRQSVEIKQVFSRFGATGTVVGYQVLMWLLMIVIMFVGFVVAAVAVTAATNVSGDTLLNLTRDRNVLEVLRHLIPAQTLIPLVFGLVVMMLALVVVVLCVVIRFTLVIQIIADVPETPLTTAMTLSNKMLKGRKRTLIKLLALPYAVLVLFSLLMAALHVTGVANVLVMTVFSIASYTLITCVTTQLYLILRGEFKLNG